MKKILFLLFIATVAFGQARNTLPDSITAHRAELDVQDVLLNTLSSTVTSHTSTLSSHTSSLSSLSMAVNAHDDSVDALRNDLQDIESVNADQDDSLTAIRTDVNTNVDSLEAIREDINDIVNVSNVGDVIQDSIKADTRFFSVSLTYPQSAENRGLFRAPFNMQITKVYGVIATDGGTNDSIKVNVEFGSNRTTALDQVFLHGAWVNSTSGENLSASIDSDIITKGYWVWFTTENKVGVVTDLLITVEYIKQ